MLSTVEAEASAVSSYIIIFDLTAGVYFNFYNNILLIL